MKVNYYKRDDINIFGSIMSSPSSREMSRRRSIGQQNHQVSVEEQALNLMAQEAESRMSSSQAVLAEARTIRSKELQRIRQETMDLEEEEEDEVDSLAKSKDSTSAISPSLKKSKSSDTRPAKDGPSNTTENNCSADQLSSDPASLKTQLMELESKYNKVMMANAQLDNEKIVIRYEVDLLKDKLSDVSEQLIELNQLLRCRNKELEDVRFELRDEKDKNVQLTGDVKKRDELIKAHGLQLITSDEIVTVEYSDVDSGDKTMTSSSHLLPSSCAEILKNYEGSSLGEKLNKLVEEKQSLSKENERLQHELDLERSRVENLQKYQQPAGTTDVVTLVTASASDNTLMTDGESKKNQKDLKLKLKRAEKEITTLQGSITRLESQVNRYKNSAESLEKAEELLKQERKSMKTELREAHKEIEELTSQNRHLSRKLERVKPSKTSNNNTSEV